MSAIPNPAYQGQFDSPRSFASIVDDLAELAPLTSGTRFAEYSDAMRAFDGSGRVFGDLDIHGRALLRHAVGESMEALDTFDALTATPQVANWEKEWRRILPGDVTARSSRHFIELAGCATLAAETGEARPLGDLVRTRIENLHDGGDQQPAEVQTTEEGPRNAAFELWLACLFRRAGLSPQKSEPDWVLPTPIGPIPVAAKRVQSIGALLPRIREGAAQISRQVQCGAASAGIVAVDLTLVCDLHRKHWTISREAESFELHAALVATMRDLHPQVMSAVRGRPDVFAMLLHAKALVFVRETQRFFTVRPILLAALVPTGHPRNEWLRQFAGSIR